jgi:hypothetical protein
MRKYTSTYSKIRFISKELIKVTLSPVALGMLGVWGSETLHIPK